MLRIAIPLVVALAGATLSAQPQGALLGETNPFAALAGNRFDGAWWLEQRGGSPVIIQFHRDGTSTSISATDEDPQLPFKLSPLQGIWRRSGPRSLTGLWLRFVRNPEGATIGYEKIRSELSFGSDFSTMEGTFSIEVLACEDVPLPPNPSFFSTLPVCPNPTSEAVGEFPPAVQDVPARAFRILLD